MGFVAELQAKGPGNEHFPRNIVRPGFSQGPHEAEQDRALRQGNRHACTAHDVPAGIHHQRCRGQQCFHFIE
ncbi:hypothetical protein D3C86_1762170 [compost metagenome]